MMLLLDQVATKLALIEQDLERSEEKVELSERFVKHFCFPLFYDYCIDWLTICHSLSSNSTVMLWATTFIFSNQSRRRPDWMRQRAVSAWESSLCVQCKCSVICPYQTYAIFNTEHAMTNPKLIAVCHYNQLYLLLSFIHFFRWIVHNKLLFFACLSTSSLTPPAALLSRWNGRKMIIFIQITVTATTDILFDRTIYFNL